MKGYQNRLKLLRKAPPILADYPEFIAPLECDRRYLAPPLVGDAQGNLAVRAWRYWYNARGIVETENLLGSRAVAIVVVHPWGVDDGRGLQTPEPAGCAFFCTKEKNELCHKHIAQVLNPFLRRLRNQVGLIAYSLPGKEDAIRKLLYASIGTEPDELNPARGEQMLRERLAAARSCGAALVEALELDESVPVRSYLDLTPATDAQGPYNGPDFWSLPMSLAASLERAPGDRVFYDGEGYDKVRDYLKTRNIRHVLLAGYCTDMCVVSTTCGYQNLSRDFNLFLVGDATLATFPASTTPRYATQAALTSAALTQLITQTGWVKIVGSSRVS